jgi:acid phosphatase (class A)
MRRIALIAAATMLVAAAGQKPAVPLLLNASNLDPALVLPDPPRDGTPIAKAELAELHAMDATRTPEEAARARADGETRSVTIFDGVMGPAFDLEKLPATKALFHVVRDEEKAAADRAKDHFKRNRPWIVDASLHPCSMKDDPQSSYPSGHTTMGYSMASILARLVPSKAPAIMARAAEYAHSRLVCEVHFPSDVTAGQSYGMMVAERLMEQPAFQTQFLAARRELIKAGITSR